MTGDRDGMAPPGWYPDANGQRRWWTGERWGGVARPRPRGRRVLTVVLIGGAVIAFAIASAWGFWVYANHDRLESIDDPTVADAAADACREMSSVLARIAADPPASGRLDAEADAVRAMVDRIRSLGDETIDGDIPTGQWLDDWEALASAHATGAPTPLDQGGVPIVDRMDELVNWSSIPDCVVPDVLAEIQVSRRA